MVAAIYLAVKAITVLIGKYVEFQRRQEALISGQKQLNELLAQGSEAQIKVSIYLPKQKFSKILSIISSVTVLPVISPK